MGDAGSYPAASALAGVLYCPAAALVCCTYCSAPMSSADVRRAAHPLTAMWMSAGPLLPSASSVSASDCGRAGPV